MSTQPKPFGVRLKQPGQRKDEAACVALGYPADSWDGELTFLHAEDAGMDQWSVFLPHHCDEWVIAIGSREEALAAARRFRDELDLAIGVLAGEIIVHEDGHLSQAIPLRRRDPAEAAALIRAGYRERGIPDDVAEAMITEILREDGS